jgi:hypothetical protein
VLTQTIRKLLAEPRPDLPRLAELRDEAARQGIVLDEMTLSAAARDALVHAALQVAWLVPQMVFENGHPTTRCKQLRQRPFPER